MRAACLALLLLVWVALAGAQELKGRLFFTPTERAALENARRNKIKAEELAAAAASKPRVAPARDVTINGMVRRSDGESVVWVNGKPLQGRSEDGLSVVPARTHPGSVIVHLPQGGPPVELKVGQNVDVSSGTISDSFGRARSARGPTPPLQATPTLPPGATSEVTPVAKP